MAYTISVLVALTVFFLLLVCTIGCRKTFYSYFQIDIVPATSETIPVIGKYLLFTLLVVTLSVVSTVVILNIHHQPARPLPAYIRRYFIDFLGPRVLANKLPRPPKVETKQGALKVKERVCISKAAIIS